MINLDPKSIAINDLTQFHAEFEKYNAVKENWEKAIDGRSEEDIKKLLKYVEALQTKMFNFFIPDGTKKTGFNTKDNG